jgi:hypothetical protein
MADVPSGPSLDSTPHYAKLKKNLIILSESSHYVQSDFSYGQTVDVLPLISESLPLLIM